MKHAQFTKRERIIRALHYQPVDRLPWSPLIEDYFISSLPGQGMPMETIEAMRYIGNDIMERHVAFATSLYRDLTRRVENRNGKTRVYFDTPVGSIYQEYSVTGNTSFATKHFITKPEDLKIYQYIAEHTDYRPEIEKFAERDRYIGDDGIATASGPESPIQEMLQKLCGVENTIYLMYDYPDEMDELLNAMHQRNLKHYRALAQYPTEVVIDYEDTSSTVMNPSMFQNYTAPVIEDYAKIMHDSGKVFITHMCGHLSTFAEMIGCGTQDGIDSVCPPDTGDFYAWDARKCWGDKKVIIGGIDPAELSRISVEKSVERTREILDRMPDLNGFILSTGDAVAYGTPIENLKAITDYLNEYGYF